MSEQVGEIHVDVHADTTGLAGEVERGAERAARGVRIEIPADLDKAATAKLRAEAERAARRAQTSVQFSADADFADLAAQARAAARAAKMRVEVEVHLDKKGFIRDSRGLFRSLTTGNAASLGELQDALADFGEQGRQANGIVGTLSGSLSNLSSVIPLVGQAIRVWLISSVASALPFVASLGAAVVALAGQVVTAAAGLGVGLVGGVAALGAAAVTTMVGVHGLADAFSAVAKAQDEQARTGKVSAATLEAQQQALGSLAPSARSFVLAVMSLSDEWANLQRVVQGRLFAGLSDDVKALSDNLLPALASGLGSVADVLNDLVEGFLRWAASARGAQQIGNLFKGLAPVIDSLARAAGSFGQGFLTLLIAAMPFIQRFAKAVEGIGDAFANWATDVVSSGALADFLDRAAEAGSTLWDILRNVASIIASVFSGSGDLGSDLLHTIEELTSRLADFLKSPEGQEQLRTFFEQVGQALSVLGNIARIVWPILVGFFDGFVAWLPVLSQVTGFLAQFSGAFEVVGHVLFAITSQLSVLGSILVPIFALLSQFGPQIAGAFSIALGAVGGFFASLPALAASAIGTLVGMFVGLAGQLFSAAGNFLSALGAWLSGSGSVAAAAVRAIIGPFSGLAGAIFSAAGNFISALGGWMSGAASVAARTASAIVSEFVGLNRRIIDAIGPVVVEVGLSMAGLTGIGFNIGRQLGGGAHGLVAGPAGDIPSTAHGIYRTAGPEVRLIGEAGPEVVVPLTPSRTLDPGVQNVLMRVAENHGLADRRPNVNQTIVVPTDDPEAAAMAVLNRLAFAGVV